MKFLYTITADNRQSAQAIAAWETDKQSSIYKTLAFVFVHMIVIIMLCIFIFKTKAFYSVIIYICMMCKLIFKLEKITILRNRTSIPKFMLLLLHLTASPWAILRNMDERLQKLIIECEELLWHKTLREHNVSRYHIDTKFNKEKINDISPYWEAAGLTIPESLAILSCVRVKAIDPLKETLHKERSCFKMHKLFITDISLIDEAEKWNEADLSDVMHCQSILRRVIGNKQEPDLTKNVDFLAYIVASLSQLHPVDIPNEELVIKALSTPGSAGQFAKKSQIEKLWKANDNEDMISTWLSAVGEIINATAVTGYIPEEIVEYMLYRKREALPYTPEGKIKVTRLMNAPNLVVRITDSVVLGKLNRDYENKRAMRIPNIGLNIFIEMKMIIVQNTDFKYMELDISDFDGGITSFQILANGYARFKACTSGKQELSELLYLRPRYLKHAIRTVKSTWGISYSVVGQQASGDITTSDDNSEKSAVVAARIVDTCRSHNLIEDSYVRTHGDDNLTMMKLSETTSISTIKQLATEIIKSTGWQMKPESLIITDGLQNGEPMFLSHSVKEKRFASMSMSRTLTFATLVRDHERLVAKWSIAAEVDEELSAIASCKLVSKYLSFLMASLGHPDVMMACVVALIKLRSCMIITEGQYTWLGVRATTVEDVTLNKMIELQLPVTLTTVYSYIEVTDQEKQTIDLLEVEYNKTLDKLTRETGIRYNTRHLVTQYEGSWWNYQCTLESLVCNYIDIDRVTNFKRPAESIKWWESNFFVSPSDFSFIDNTLGSITKCDHYDCDIYKTVTIWSVNYMCDKCWDERKEHQYTTINCKIIKGLPV